MDIEKEREAFEKAFAQTEFYRNKADIYSLLADINDETFDFFRKNGFGDYSIGEAQAAWSAWQAAQAKAVPDGFVLVPKEPTQKMLDATINLAIPAVYVDSISGQHKLKVVAYYKAMINKAQE